MRFTSSIGEEREIDLDVDRVIEYERAHPEWSLMGMMSSMDNARFSDFDILAYLMGFDGLKDLLKSGFSIGVLSEAVQHSEVLGFTEQE